MKHNLRNSIGVSLVLALTVPACVLADHCCPSHRAAKATPPPPARSGMIKGEFSLSDAATGRSVNRDTYDGRHRLVFFGFTHCRVVCPLGLVLMRDMLQELDGQEVEVVPIFVTIDPRRDTPERLVEYLGYYDRRIIGLYGNDAETSKAMRSFRIEAPKSEVRSGTDYQFDHPSLIMLMDRDGTYIKSIPSTGNAKTLAAEIAQAIQPE